MGLKDCFFSLDSEDHEGGSTKWILLGSPTRQERERMGSVYHLGRESGLSLSAPTPEAASVVPGWLAWESLSKLQSVLASSEVGRRIKMCMKGAAGGKSF